MKTLKVGQRVQTVYDAERNPSVIGEVVALLPHSKRGQLYELKMVNPKSGEYTFPSYHADELILV